MVQVKPDDDEQAQPDRCYFNKRTVVSSTSTPVLVAPSGQFSSRIRFPPPRIWIWL